MILGCISEKPSRSLHELQKSLKKNKENVKTKKGIPTKSITSKTKKSFIMQHIIGSLEKQTKEKLLGIINERIYRISEELELIFCDPSMYEMPSELPVYFLGAEAETAILNAIKNYLERIEES